MTLDLKNSTYEIIGAYHDCLLEWCSFHGIDDLKQHAKECDYNISQCYPSLTDFIKGYQKLVLQTTDNSHLEQEWIGDTESIFTPENDLITQEDEFDDDQ